MENDEQMAGPARAPRFAINACHGGAHQFCIGDTPSRWAESRGKGYIGAAAARLVDAWHERGAVVASRGDRDEASRGRRAEEGGDDQL